MLFLRLCNILLIFGWFVLRKFVCMISICSKKVKWVILDFFKGVSLVGDMFNFCCFVEFGFFFFFMEIVNIFMFGKWCS